MVSSIPFGSSRPNSAPNVTVCCKVSRTSCSNTLRFVPLLIGVSPDRLCLKAVLEMQRCRQHPGTYDSVARASVHRALEGLQTIDLPAVGVAPTFGQRVPDRVNILPQRSNEALHRVEAGSMGLFEPRVEHAALLRNSPRSRMASCRITTKSADAPLSASIFAACSGFREARGLMQSAAATIGEISQPVVGSTART